MGAHRVVMTTTDSNLFGGRSGHVYTFTRRPDGTTDVDAVVVREGKNLKGRALGLVLGGRDSDLFLECARDPEMQRRTGLAMSRGFQTHDGEIALGSLLNGLG